MVSALIMGRPGERKLFAAENNNDDDRWIPEDPEAEGYFNYHPSSRFGPSNWGTFSSFHIKKMPERKYWKYYSDLYNQRLVEISTSATVEIILATRIDFGMAAIGVGIAINSIRFPRRDYCTSYRFQSSRR